MSCAMCDEADRFHGAAIRWHDDLINSFPPNNNLFIYLSIYLFFGSCRVSCRWIGKIIEKKRAKE